MKRTDENDPFKRPFSTLEDLVDRIKYILNCPVTIEDPNHHLLAYSTHGDETDAARIATIIKRRVPERVINKFWKEGIIPKLMQSEEAIRIPEMKDIGLRDRIAISIRRNSEVLGYIWVVEENEKLSNSQLALLKEAAKSAAPLLLKLHLQKKKKEEDYQEFFWLLLTGHYKSHNEIKNKFHQLSITMPEQFAILVFRFEQEITRKVEEQISYLITTSQKITNHFLVVMRNELILIASPHQSQPDEKIFKEFISFFISEMKNRFSIIGIKGSSGTIYNSFERAETSYQEALKVLQLKEQFPDELAGIFHYHQLGIFRYLDAILHEKKANPYEHPAISKLEAYDKQNKTTLLDTLEVFIQADSNINEAAKKLFVHANTLNYRMKRIMKIGEIDLKNPNEKMSLYLDLKVRCLEKNNHL